MRICDLCWGSDPLVLMFCAPSVLSGLTAWMSLSCEREIASEMERSVSPRRTFLRCDKLRAMERRCERERGWGILDKGRLPMLRRFLLDLQPRSGV